MRKWRCVPALRITVGILILTGVAITGEAKHQLKFKFTTISVPSEPDTSIFGVSKAGVMVGTYVDSNAVYHGFIRSTSGKVTTVDDPNGANTILEGISPKGKYIVGTYFSSDLTTRQGFLYQNATFVNLVPSGSTTSAAFGVNDSSQVVGEYVDSQGNGHGYYWDGTQYQTLDDPNGTNSAALGINNAGAITLYWFDSSGNVEGALYSGGQYTTINVPGAVDSVPWGIDSAGDIVFDWDWNTTGKSSHGALRTSRGVFYDFDDPEGPALTQPRGINDKKLLVGSYYNLSYSLQALYNFCSAQGCTDGANPRAGLIQDAAGNFYGTTYAGGANAGSNCASSGVGCGTVFEVDTAGNETVLYSFCSASNCADGANPAAGLTRDFSGSFYGTTLFGGTSESGTVFKLDTAGNETVLYSFCSVSNCADGASPAAGLIQDVAGNLYGVTHGGGATADGTVFKVDTAGNETVLYSFCSVSNCRDGADPAAGLIQDAAGNFYGMTEFGGANNNTNCYYLGCGTVFKLDTAGNETVLYSFCSVSNCRDGVWPVASLIQDAVGNLYGTTWLGGAGNSQSCYDGGCGTVFKLDSTGNETTLYAFCSVSNCTDGLWPVAGLIQDAAGNLYGTTQYGGATDGGTVFKIDTAGNETVLYSFCVASVCADGVWPLAGLVQDASGNLYGTTDEGGAKDSGVVFKLQSQAPVSFSGFKATY